MKKNTGKRIHESGESENFSFNKNLFFSDETLRRPRESLLFSVLSLGKVKSV